MSFSGRYLDDGFLTDGVMSRRCVAWVIDVVLIAMLIWVLWWILVLFGLLTVGLGWGAMGILPFVPFCYQFFSLLSAGSATPGQRMMGLIGAAQRRPWAADRRCRPCSRCCCSYLTMVRRPVCSCS